MGAIVRMNMQERFEAKYQHKLDQWMEADVPVIYISGGVAEPRYIPKSGCVIVDFDNLEEVGEENIQECVAEY